MNREILFRGKRIDNGEWVYGYLYITHNGEHEIGCYNADTNIERWTFIVDPATVGQYTGLTDKNGKRIFEGDIVTLFHNVPCLVIWNIEGAAFEVEWRMDGQTYYNTLCGAERLTVIGNVVDNPELMKGDE